MQSPVISFFVLQLPDKHGITPLLAAIYEGHTDCVKLLLSKVFIIFFLFLLNTEFRLNICLHVFVRKSNRIIILLVGYIFVSFLHTPDNAKVREKEANKICGGDLGILLLRHHEGVRSLEICQKTPKNWGKNRPSCNNNKIRQLCFSKVHQICETFERPINNAIFLGTLFWGYPAVQLYIDQWSGHEIAVGCRTDIEQEYRKFCMCICI